MKLIGSIHITEYAKGMKNEDLQLEVELPVGNYALFVQCQPKSGDHQERDFTTTLTEVKGPLSKAQIEAIRHASALLALEGYEKQSDDLFAIVAPPKDQGCIYRPQCWICTREPGHEGPCAAVEVEVKS